MFEDYPKKTLLLQILLFVLTIITTTFAGTEWIYGQSFFFTGKSGFFYENIDFNYWKSWVSIEVFKRGLQFSEAILSIGKELVSSI